MRWIPAHLTVMLFASGIFAGSTAHAENIAYRSAHPIPEELPGNFCHIEVAHTHTYTPHEAMLEAYVRHDEEGIVQLEFVGDPTVLDFEGPVATYGEAHPMHFQGGSNGINDLCQIEGSHYHLYEPFDPTQYEDRKGTYYFGSYKAAMLARRDLRKLRKAEARELKKAERQRLQESRLAERAARNSTKTVNRRGNGTTVSSPARTTDSGSTRPTSTSKTKPPKKGFRSWMDRRRGK
jgi:hypothetical protein